MDDYVKQLDAILSSTGENILQGKGTVSHKQAMDKAIKEYKKYQAKTLSPVEKEYWTTIKRLSNESKQGSHK